MGQVKLEGRGRIRLAASRDKTRAVTTGKAQIDQIGWVCDRGSRGCFGLLASLRLQDKSNYFPASSPIVTATHGRLCQFPQGSHMNYDGKTDR